MWRNKSICKQIVRKNNPAVKVSITACLEDDAVVRTVDVSPPLTYCDRLFHHSNGGASCHLETGGEILSPPVWLCTLRFGCLASSARRMISKYITENSSRKSCSVKTDTVFSPTDGSYYAGLAVKMVINNQWVISRKPYVMSLQ